MANLGDRRVLIVERFVRLWTKDKRLLRVPQGHAKNFSIFLSPGGGFRLAPLYDVVSAQPSLDACQIRHNQMKLAMAVGENRHYTINSITERHFVQSAATAGLGTTIVTEVINDPVANGETTLERVLADLPKGFPEKIALSIAQGFRSRLKQLNRS